MLYPIRLPTPFLQNSYGTHNNLDVESTDLKCYNYIFFVLIAVTMY